MRRVSMFVAFCAVTALLLGVASPAQAQLPGRVDALIAGQTIPPAGSPGPSGTDRTSGSSTFSQVQISAVIDCGGNVTVANVAQGANQVLNFTSDDDVTDGFGEIQATGAAEAFVDLNANEVGVDLASGADVTVDVEGGRFHRIAGVVEVDLVIDVTVERDGGGRCVLDDHELKVVLELLPNTDANLTSGFILVGAGTTDPGGPSLLRTVCGVVDGQEIPNTNAVVCPPAN